MRKFLVLAGVAAVLVLGADAQKAASDWAGVYSVSFENSDISDAKWTDTDVLTIAPTDASHANVSVELHFFNGHSCSFEGETVLEGDELVHHGKYDDITETTCTLVLERTKDKDGAPGITVTERGKVSACKMQTCGMRGGYGAFFPLSARKPLAAVVK